MNNELHSEIPLSFHLPCQDIPPEGLERLLEIHEDNKKELVTLLNLVALKSIVARYTVKPVGKEKYQLTGQISAEVIQHCRISMEEMTSQIDDRFEVVFLPEEKLNSIRGNQTEVDVVFDEDHLEPYREGKLPVGEIFYQYVALSIDPYPEITGVERSIISESNDLSDPESPFSVLKKISNPLQND